jgi:hypothetical protein
MSPEEVNILERRYFNFLIKLFETKGTTFTKNLLSQYSIRDNWLEYSGDMSFVQRGLESVVQGVIFESVDWEICSTPEGSDSVFQTSRAMIHIDAKAYKYSDGDARGNKITLGPNQTSCFTENHLLYDNVPFISKLPHFYDHKMFGRIPCLTFFIKLIYNLDNELETFRNFELILCSLPNGFLNETIGTDHFQAGRGINHNNNTRLSVRLNYNSLEVDRQNPFKWQRFCKLNMI